MKLSVITFDGGAETCGLELTNNVDLASHEEDLEAEVKRDTGLDVGANVCNDGKARVNSLRISLDLLSQSCGRTWKNVQ